MEYLKSIQESLKIISEENIRWVDVLNRPDLIRGTLRIASDQVDFIKFPYEARQEILEYGEKADAEMKKLYRNTSGCRIIFNTDSRRFIIKAHLKRKWSYRKMTLWNSSGFDVYEIQNGKYIHKTVVAPYEGKNIFAEQISCRTNQICIFLPTYNCIESLLLGIEANADFNGIAEEEYLPVVFYGNSITEGASASRSGNAFPNVFHRMTKYGIINLSCSSCCRGLESMGSLIGKINCSAIVIDYTRNAATVNDLRDTHERFYKQVRKAHPDKLIVFMTSSNFNLWKKYFEYDEIVKKTYHEAVERGENVKLLDVMGLFKKEEYSLISVDGIHINDIGMYRVAEALSELMQLA